MPAGTSREYPVNQEIDHHSQKPTWSEFETKNRSKISRDDAGTTNPIRVCNSLYFGSTRAMCLVEILCLAPPADHLTSHMQSGSEPPARPSTTAQYLTTARVL